MRSGGTSAVLAVLVGHVHAMRRGQHPGVQHQRAAAELRVGPDRRAGDDQRRPARARRHRPASSPPITRPAPSAAAACLQRLGLLAALGEFERRRLVAGSPDAAGRAGILRRRRAASPATSAAASGSLNSLTFISFLLRSSNSGSQRSSGKTHADPRHFHRFRLAGPASGRGSTPPGSAAASSQSPSIRPPRLAARPRRDRPARSAPSAARPSRAGTAITTISSTPETAPPASHPHPDLGGLAEVDPVRQALVAARSAMTCMSRSM